MLCAAVVENPHRWWWWCWWSEVVATGARTAAARGVIGDTWEEEVRYGFNIRPIHGRMDTVLAICWDIGSSGAMPVSRIFCRCLGIYLHKIQDIAKSQFAKSQVKLKF